MATHKALQFSDGNVEIHFSNTDDKYILHSHVLALHSQWFKACLSERWNSSGEAMTVVDGKHYWVFELRFEKGSELGTLIRKPTHDATANASGDETEMIDGIAKNMPTGARKTAGTAIDLHSSRLPSIKAHQDMLAALYHAKPSCVQKSFGPGALGALVLLAKTAEMYGCQDLVKPPIEVHLYESQKEVLKICRTSTSRVLELAVTLKINWVFVKAAVPLICCDKDDYEREQSTFRKLGIEALIARKRLQFVDMLKDCDLKLLQCSLPSDASSHHTEYMAVIYFREWVVRQLGNGGGSALRPRYAYLYRRIRDQHKSEEVAEYTMKDVSDYFSKVGKKVSASDLSRIATELKNIFAVANKIVTDIMVDQLYHESSRLLGRFSPLTCVKIHENELPWVNE